MNFLPQELYTLVPLKKSKISLLWEYKNKRRKASAMQENKVHECSGPAPLQEL